MKKLGLPIIALLIITALLTLFACSPGIYWQAPTTTPTSSNTVALLLDGGAQVTNNQTLSIASAYSPTSTGTVQMCISESSNCSGCTYAPYQALSSLLVSTGFGTKTISEKIKISGVESSCVTSSIIYENVSVGSRYTVAPNWNDYSTRDGSTACVGTETVATGNLGDSSPCVHGGEKRVLYLPGATTCSGLYATDALGVFDWYCSIISGQVGFVSSFKTGKGLKDLVNLAGNGFLANSVSVTKNNLVSVTTSSSTWWTNTVTTTNAVASTTTLAGASTIYVIVANELTSHGYNISGEKIALVTLPSITVTAGAGIPFCASGLNNCLLNVTTGHHFAWIEGRFGGIATVGNATLVTFNAPFSRVHGFIEEGSGNGLGTGILIQNSIFAYIDQSKIMNNNRGVDIEVSNYAIIATTISGNNGNESFYSANSNFLVFTQDYAVSSGKGIFLQNLSTPTITNFTASNIWSDAALSMDVVAIPNPTANQVYMENVSIGLHLQNSANNGYFSQMAMSEATSFQIELNASTGNYFLGNILLSGSSACSVVASGGGSVLTNGCGVSSIGTNLVTGESLASAMIGSVVDTAQGGINSQMYAGSMNWVDFDDSTRSYGGVGSGNFLNASSQGGCSSGFNCSIWDFALSKLDHLVRNTSGNGTSQNGAFVPNAACPSAANGNQQIVNASLGTTYLMNAVEIIGTGGNDNGLCEAGETCMYTPNFGAYQGEGVSDVCIYSASGGVQGVTMYGYETNGK